MKVMMSMFFNLHACMLQWFNTKVKWRLDRREASAERRRVLINDGFAGSPYHIFSLLTTPRSFEILDARGEGVINGIFGLAQRLSVEDSIS